jgi:hypothetical protein
MSTQNNNSPLRVSASPRENSHSAAPGGTALVAPSDAQLQPAAAAPGTLTIHQADDSLMGQQLTEQYHRAIGGIREVLRFGAMMMQLRNYIESTRGLDHHTTTGKGAKYDANTGVDAWLKQFAPEVKKATAYRFLHVAESIAQQFQTPAKITFADLATKAPEELPEKLRSKQAELWEFVDGTSQRSWLDAFKPRPTLGGYHPRQGRPPTLDEQMAAMREIAHQDFEAIYNRLHRFAFANRTEGYDLLGDADKMLFREIITEIHTTICRREK